MFGTHGELIVLRGAIDQTQVRPSVAGRRCIDCLSSPLASVVPTYQRMKDPVVEFQEGPIPIGEMKYCELLDIETHTP